MLDNQNEQQIDGANWHVVPVTDDTFISEVLEAPTPVLVDFMAQWCGPCKFMGPIFEQMAPDYTDKVKFVRLDVDESPGVASALGIESIPTFALFNGNVLLAAGVGAMPQEDLQQWIDDGLARKDSLPGEAESPDGLEQ